LTEKGNRLLKSAPEVAQGLLVSGLEKISGNNLMEIDKSMKTLVRIFGAQKIPPKLILSTEVNVPIDMIQKRVNGNKSLNHLK
jgi:hypothetical protein